VKKGGETGGETNGKMSPFKENIARVEQNLHSTEVGWGNG